MRLEVIAGRPQLRRQQQPPQVQAAPQTPGKDHLCSRGAQGFQQQVVSQAPHQAATTHLPIQSQEGVSAFVVCLEFVPHVTEIYSNFEISNLVFLIKRY